MWTNQCPYFFLDTRDTRLPMILFNNVDFPEFVGPINKIVPLFMYYLTILFNIINDSAAFISAYLIDFPSSVAFLYSLNDSSTLKSGS